MSIVLSSGAIYHPPGPSPDTVDKAKADYAAGRIDLTEFEDRVERVLRDEA